MAYVPVNVAPTTITVTIVAIDKIAKTMSLQMPGGWVWNLGNVNMASLVDNMQAIMATAVIPIGKQFTITYPINAFFDDASGSHALQ